MLYGGCGPRFGCLSIANASKAYSFYHISSVLGQIDSFLKASLSKLVHRRLRAVSELQGSAKD
jgi:hypothetical protein